MQHGIGKTVKLYDTLLKSRTFFMALTLAGCAGLLQTTLVAQTAPAVIFSNPSRNAINVPTSINSSKNLVSATAPTATFSRPMNPATIDSMQPGQQRTFTLVDSYGNNVPGTVLMDTTNTIATFTPMTWALNANTSYVATISTTAATTGGIALANPVSWTFTTKNVPFTSQAPVDLGTAGTFAILSKTGVTDVYASVVNGDVGSSPITGAASDLP
jgi:hypothetical protein